MFIILIGVNQNRIFFVTSFIHTEYLKSNGKAVSDIFAAPNLESRTVAPFTFSQVDWGEFIKEFEAYLKNLKITELNDTKKLKIMIEFTQMQLSTFLQGK